VTGPLNNAMYPYMAKNKDWALFYKLFLISFFILAFGCLILSLYAQDFLVILFGKVYADATDVLLVFLLIVVVNYVTMLQSHLGIQLLEP